MSRYEARDACVRGGGEARTDAARAPFVRLARKEALKLHSKSKITNLVLLSFLFAWRFSGFSCECYFLLDFILKCCFYFYSKVYLPLTLFIFKESRN